MNKKTLLLYIRIFLTLSLLGTTYFLSSCGKDSAPSNVIEENPGGLELLEREFAPCTEDTKDLNPPQYLRSLQDQSSQSHWGQQNTESLDPHQFSSLNFEYPERGSYRQSKAQIMDIVDRYIWSPENGARVKLLSYFDMVILINSAERDLNFPEARSAQRMQIYVRRNQNVHEFSDFERINTWPISTGTACGQKIETFTGVYKLDPGRLHEEYFSKQYDDANMYETMFLYHYYQTGKKAGVAIHGTYATSLLGRQSSGGCIRVYRDNSKCLFETIQGTRSTQCLGGGKIGYSGSVPSFNPYWGEADPQYLNASGSPEKNGNHLKVSGRRVLVAIFNEKTDSIEFFEEDEQ